MNITIRSLIHNPSMKDDCIMKIREATERDETLKLLKKIVYDGWGLIIKEAYLKRYVHTGISKHPYIL